MGELHGTIPNLHDVSGAIQHEKDRTARIVASIADGAFTVDRALVVRSFSQGMERLTGLSAADAVGRPCAEVLSGTSCDTGCPLSATLERRANGEPCRESFRVGGRALPVSITAALLTDAGEDERLVAVVRDLGEIERLRRELADRHTRHDLVGRSRAMRELGAAIDSVADTDAPVLITGETGTGKSLVARAIHGQSRRRDRPFVNLSCAALNEILLESELFGHVRGAFTGAAHDKPGRFEAAAGGTILLDEIGDTTIAFQARLLRVLQEGTFERMGDTATRRADVRVIAATNRDLRQLVRDGTFNEDLHYRLAIFPIHVAPLRERSEDVPLLVDHFVQKFRPRYFAGREDEFQGISNRALTLLLEYEWPGNVRELEHAIEYAMVSTTVNRIERVFLPLAIRQLQVPDPVVQLPRSIAPVVIEAPAEPGGEGELRQALDAHRWNASRTARALGISRTTLWRRMKRFALLPRP